MKHRLRGDAAFKNRKIAKKSIFGNPYISVVCVINYLWCKYQRLIRPTSALKKIIRKPRELPSCEKSPKMPQLRARAASPPVTRAPPSWFCFVRKFLLFFLPPSVLGLTAWSRHNSLVIGELTECSKAPLLKCGATIGWDARSSRMRGSKWLLLAAAGAHVFGSQPCRQLPRVSCLLRLLRCKRSSCASSSLVISFFAISTRR